MEPLVQEAARQRKRQALGKTNVTQGDSGTSRELKALLFGHTKRKNIELTLDRLEQREVRAAVLPLASRP